MSRGTLNGWQEVQNWRFAVWHPEVLQDVPVFVTYAW